MTRFNVDESVSLRGSQFLTMPNPNQIKLRCQYIFTYLVIIDVLSQLAVLTATPVDCGMLHRRIPRGLAGYARAHAGEGGLATFGNRLTAVVAIFGAWSSGQARTCAGHCVLNAIVDLVLHRAVARPAAGHYTRAFCWRSKTSGSQSSAVADRVLRSVMLQSPTPYQRSSYTRSSRRQNELAQDDIAARPLWLRRKHVAHHSV